MKFLIFIFLLISCSKHSSLNTEGNSWKLLEFYPKIKEIKNIPWEIGKKREAEVSQGLLITLELPIISEDDQKLILEKYHVDSFLIEIKKVSGPTPRLLGHLRIPFKNINRFMQEISMKILYHPASISQQFRRFHCPAFNHRKKLTSFHINYEDNKNEDVIFEFQGNFPGTYVDVANFPASFSGDLALEGIFDFKFMLFDSLTKKIYSKSSPLNGKIIVEEETDISVPSCAGVTEEINPDRDEAPIKLENFRIK
jgi:hypothetical protein